MHPSNYDAQNINLQVMDDGCNSSVFPFSNPQNQNHHHSLYESHLHPSQGTKRADQISHRPTIPVACQLFQQHGFHEDVRLQHHQQLSHPSFSTVNFMGVNESGGVGAMNHSQDDTFLLQNRHNCLLTPNCWNDHEDFVIKGKPLYGGDNKQCSTEDRAGEMEGKVYKKPMQQAEDFRAERCRDSSGKYRLLGELEAMWNLAKFDEVNQASGSVSALTGENSLKKAGFRRMLRDVPGHCGGGNGGVANVSTGVGHGSVPCVGEEASWRKIQKKKRKMIMKEQLCSMIGFFESLVEQVMDHQEFLHRKLLEVIERMDKERTQREEEWRCQETAKHNREALARTHEQAMASKREALIASYLEKITGQSINIPERTPMFQPEGEIEHRNELAPVEVDANSRWPRTEVEAPVRVRSALETKFQEPGLERPLREEVSSVVASNGYNRSAKRCKGNGRT